MLYTYTLLRNGDAFEKYYWDKFLNKKFPSYEKYWLAKIIPLTNRPRNIHFKSSTELKKLGYSDEDICLAQLHYTLLRRIARCFELLQYLQSNHNTDLLSEGLSHLISAQDVAFEFLQRIASPGIYGPWLSKKKGSQEARSEWQRNNTQPLQQIRDYRNHLIHGRLSPSIVKDDKILIPKIGKELNYLDWRLITDWNPENAVQDDFDLLDNILRTAWEETICYCEKEWQKIAAYS